MRPRRGTQEVRERSAKPLRVGSIPTRASTKIITKLPHVTDLWLARKLKPVLFRSQTKNAHPLPPSFSGGHVSDPKKFGNRQESMSAARFKTGPITNRTGRPVPIWIFRHVRTR